MTTKEAENKALVRRSNEELWGEGEFGLIDEYVAEDYVEHNTASPEPIRGPEGYRRNVETVRTAFPDLEVTTEDLIAEGDRVATRYTLRGTHRGPLMGTEPTGAEVEFEGISIGELGDGRVVAGWSNIDVFGMMQQLGVVEPPGREGRAATTGTEAENKELVRRTIEEAFDGGDVDVLDEVLADGFVAHAPAEPGHGPETQDRDRLEEEIDRNHRIFPDLSFTVEETIAEGNAVAVRWTLRGTHEGAMPDLEPTGEEVTVRGMNVVHVEDGEIVEDWVLWDGLGMMQQLGIGPEPPG